MDNTRFMPITLESYKPLREIVFETLREAIISGKLLPGERLMEIQLAEEMGVSRTPVREAIRKLELEGLVVMVPRKGAYVAGMTVKEMVDVFEVRTALEGLAAGLAAERATAEEIEEMERAVFQISEVSDGLNLDTLVERDTNFHDLIYKASHNQRLVQIITHLREQLNRFRTTSLALPGRGKYAVDEHKGIVEAIGARDVELATNLAREHVEIAEQLFLSALGEVKKYD